MRLSKSGLQTYIKCPYAYYLRYICGYTGPPSEEMNIGTEFHDRANNFFDKISIQEMTEITDVIDLKNYIRSFYPKGELYDNFAHIQTIHFLALDNPEEFMPVEREIKIEVANAPNEILDVGIVDWITRESGITILGEYKTGKFNQGINQELMMYKCLVEHATEYKIDAICAIYPNELYGEKLPSGVYYRTPKYEEAARKKVAYVKDMIRKQKFDLKSYGLCAWCENADICFEDEMVVK